MKSSKKKNLIVILVVLLVLVIFGVTYSFVGLVMGGNKKVVITAGVLDLVLEEENEITLSNALPMYDEVGMIQAESHKFKIVNNSDSEVFYFLKLIKLEGSTLDENLVRIGVIRDGNDSIQNASYVINDILHNDYMSPRQTVEYEIRMWIDSSVTDDALINGKSLSYKLGIEVEQVEQSGGSGIK